MPGVALGLFAIRADGSGLRRLAPSGLDVASFEWSPDGSRIAYLDKHGRSPAGAPRRYEGVSFSPRARPGEVPGF